MDFVTKERIEKGWSDDQKYCVTDKNGIRYLYRVSELTQYEKKLAEFRSMQAVAALGVPMCQPIAFGTCEEGVYSLQGWIDGEDAEAVIARYSDDEQYALGLEAGRILRKIHTLPAPPIKEDWAIRFGRKLDRKLKAYRECPLRYEDGEAFFDYVHNHRHCLANRPQTYQHGDYHIGNMRIDRGGRLQIIDFNRNDYGDPWEEFNRIVWCAQASPLFASGRIDGYFERAVPTLFWRLLALYIASNTLSSLPWALPFGEAEVQTMQRQAKEVLSWYDGMRRTVPSWYRRP